MGGEDGRDGKEGWEGGMGGDDFVKDHRIVMDLCMAIPMGPLGSPYILTKHHSKPQNGASHLKSPI